MATLNKAIEIAARAHAGQKDKAGQPYVLHSLRVMHGKSSPEINDPKVNFPVLLSFISSFRFNFWMRPATF